MEIRRLGFLNTMFLVIALICCTKSNLAYATMEGPAWPVIWECHFEADKNAVVGKPVILTITLKPVLFDLGDVEIKPYASGELKTVEQLKVFKGNLKKGEKLSFKFHLIGTKPGVLAYGLKIYSADYYHKMEDYIVSNYNGSAKDDLFIRLKERQKIDPNYTKGFSGSIEIVSEGK